MESENFNDLGYYNNDKRSVHYFDYTGKTLLYPITYNLRRFQKDIISTAVRNNTLISLPPGLGKLFIAAVLVNNFQRWFLNGKILILSQTKSYLSDLIHAFSDYTSLNKELYLDLSSDFSSKESIVEKTIILTTPQKCLDMLANNTWIFHNIVLLIIFENRKIVKCDDYQKILDELKTDDFRTLMFVESAGFNSKILRQVVEDFNIHMFAVKSMESPDVKECTYCSKIESTSVEIPPHILNFKNSFYSVFEKYAKKLKDAKVISGNVAALTKPQILKAKERFQKNLPPNMPKTEQDQLIDCMTVSAFLCFGIELLHNWGVRSLHKYLLDEEKDDKLKELIAKDEHLMNEVMKLNEYLKLNSGKIDTASSHVVHPKLLCALKIVSNYFSKTEEEIKNVRIIVLCSLENVLDDIDCVFRSCPDSVRYHCIATKAKCLASEPNHKEIVQNFLDGVINVLVLSNLVDEVMEIKSSLIISLEPNKTLLKNADARFFEGTAKCMFILTKGIESLKFEALLNEKRNEQKTIDVSGILPAESNIQLFPDHFNPEFEPCGVYSARKDFKSSTGQKKLFEYMKPKESPLLFNNSNSSYSKMGNSLSADNFADFDSPSLFADDFPTLPPKRISLSRKLVNDDDLIPSYSPEKETDFNTTNDELNSFDELILDFSDTKFSKLGSREIANIENTPTSCNPVKNKSNKFSWMNRPSKQLNFSGSVSPEFKKKTVVTRAQVHCSATDNNFTDSVPSKSGKKNKNPVPVISMENIQKKSFVDSLFSDSSRESTSETECDNPVMASNSKEADFLLSKNNQTMTNYEDENKITVIEEDIISGNTSDVLFTDSFDIHQVANTVELESRYPATTICRNVSACDSNDDFDSDCEIVPDSPKDQRSCEVFSSRYVESCTQNAERSQADAKCKSQNLKEGVCNLFPDTPTNDETRCSVNDGEHSTFSQLVQSKPETKTVASLEVSFAEIPSDFLSEFDLDNLSPVKNISHRTKPSSPILLNSQKSDRNRSKMQSTNNRKTSINVNSICDLSESQLRIIDTAAVKKKSVGNQMRFSENFSSDDNNLFENIPTAPFSPKTCATERTENKYKNNSETSSNSTINCSTPKSHNFVPCSILSEGARKSELSNQKSKATSQTENDTDLAVSHFRTPDRVWSSNASTPDLIFDDYSTPEAKKSAPEISEYFKNPIHKTSSNNTKLNHPPIDFSNDSLSLSYFSTPVGIALKDKSLSINSKSSFERNSATRLSTPPSKINSSKLSTMERLNVISSRESSSHVSPSDNSDFGYDSPCPKVIRPKGTSLFKNYAQKMKQKFDMQCIQNSISSPSPAIRNEIIDSDDDISYLNTSPRNDGPTKTGTFSKDPKPFMNRNSLTLHSTPVSTSSNSSTPEPILKRPPKKIGKLKRNLAEQFLDKEAVVSGDDSGDEDENLNASKFSIDSFIDDETNKPSNMSNYLKSLKSPQNAPGRFHIPILSESKLQKNVLSQVEDYEQSYVHDSFCVNENSDSDIDDECVPSVLTQMEAKLSKKRSEKLKLKPKQNRFKRIIMNSSPDSPIPPYVSSKTRKRIKCFSSSDSDAD